MNNVKMLCYDRIDVSEEIDVNQTSQSKECDISHYFFIFFIFLIEVLSFK